MKKYAPFLVLGLSLIILLHELLLGKVLFWGLPSLQFYPWRWLAVEQLRQGQLPYWNPYNGGGAPLLANYQTAMLYPPNWLIFLSTHPIMMSIITLLHLVLCAWGMWLFAGKLGLSTFGRGVSMLSFVMGGYFINRLGSFPTVNAIVWIPWLFWQMLRIRDEHRWRDSGLFALVFGLQLLAGHAQSTLYGLLMLGLYMMWVMLRDKMSWQSSAWAFVRLGIGGLIGLGIAGWQIILTAQLLNQSQRSGGISFEAITNISYNPLRGLTLILPHFFGTPANGSYFTPGKGIYFEEVAYLGLIPFIAVLFAILGYFKWRKSLNEHPTFRDVPFWIMVGMGGILLATGRFGPFYRPLYDIVPTFDTFREPVRWLLLTAFGFSILAGIGVENWDFSLRRRYWTRLGTAGASLMFVLSLIGYVIANTNDNPEVQAIALSLIWFALMTAIAGGFTLYRFEGKADNRMASWQIGILIFIAVDLVWVAYGLNPAVPSSFYKTNQVDASEAQRIYWFENDQDQVKFDEVFTLEDYTKATQNWQSARTSLLPNLNILDGVQSLNNFDPLEPEYHVRYLALIEEKEQDSGNLLVGAGVSHVYSSTPITEWQKQAEGEFITPMPSSLAWIVPQIIWVNNDVDAEQQLLADDWHPEDAVILIGEGDSFVQNPATEFTVEQIKDATYQREYQVTSNGESALVLATTYYPGWQATLNGQEVALYRANLTFQAIIIPAGEHRITLEYQQENQILGPVISIVSLLLAFALIAFGDRFVVLYK